jgi:hypothetical protein
MTPNQLKKRSIKIQATSKKAIPISGSRFRRGQNFVEEIVNSSEDFDDFFEFEKELASMPSARESAAAAPNHEYFFQKEEPAEDYIVMEEIDPVQIDFSETIEDEEEIESETKMCKYIKSDGTRCKVHIKKNDYCRAHLIKISRDLNSN